MRELAVQALSSVEGGYDLLAPKFDYTPFRTCDGVLVVITQVRGMHCVDLMGIRALDMPLGNMA